MKKLFAFALVLTLALTLAACGCNDDPPANNGEESPNNGTPTDNVQTPEPPQGMTISEDDYALFQYLKEERAFFGSPDYHNIRILSWRFARASLSDDTETMSGLMAEGAEVYLTNYVTMDIFDEGLDFIILKDARRYGNMVTLSYEFLVKGGDSYTYITIYMENIDGGWKVTGYAFEG
jgi:hypothetical protein